MSATSAVWVVILAVLIAAGLVAMMMASRRPEEGYRARLREAMGSQDSSVGRGAVTEMRESVDGETVPLADLLADAEQRGAYVSVPERYEVRFVEITEQLAERVRGERTKAPSA